MKDVATGEVKQTILRIYYSPFPELEALRGSVTSLGHLIREQ